jgi:adenylosuccinate synthase
MPLFDAVAVRQAVKTGGIDGIALTKLDVLDGFDEVKFCTAYRCGGETYDYVPAGMTAEAALEPGYETAERDEHDAGARPLRRLIPLQAGEIAPWPELCSRRTYLAAAGRAVP